MEEVTMTIEKLQGRVAEKYKFENETAATIMRKIINEIVQETVAVLRDEKLINIVEVSNDKAT